MKSDSSDCKMRMTRVCVCVCVCVFMLCRDKEKDTGYLLLCAFVSVCQQDKLNDNNHVIHVRGGSPPK